jgi:hypothetical protein
VNLAAYLDKIRDAVLRPWAIHAEMILVNRWDEVNAYEVTF